MKIINPNNAGGEVIIDNLKLQGSYTSVEGLKHKFLELFTKYTEDYDTQFGYIAPGHGMKGKQETISSSEELASMYEFHKKKKRIMFWLKCKAPRATKRSSNDSSADAPPSKRQSSIVTMMCEVDTIVKQLKDKHGSKYTPVQLNCWAHMIHTNKHHLISHSLVRKRLMMLLVFHPAREYHCGPSVLINSISGAN